MDRIQIIMHEYNALRAEINQLTGVIPQMVSAFIPISAAVSTILLATQPKEHIVAILLGAGIFGIVILLTMIWYAKRQTLECAERISEIEAYVNGIADERILEWESVWNPRKRRYRLKADQKLADFRARSTNDLCREAYLTN